MSFNVLIWIIVLIIAYRMWLVLPETHPKHRSMKGLLNIMTVLGSGGHTAEMMPVINKLNEWNHVNSLIVVATNTDKLSLLHTSIPKSAVKEIIPRAREVGQSYISSVFTTIWSVLHCFKLLHYKPDLLIVNGPGVCVPVVLVLFLGNALGLTDTSIMFIESFCRVKSFSLTGKIIYPFCDIFLVHWRELACKKKRARVVDIFGLNKICK